MTNRTHATHMHSSVSEQAVEALRSQGCTVLKALLHPDQIQAAREQVIQHLPLFRNTRPNPSAGHLAGFHRYPVFDALHTLVSTHPTVLNTLARASGSPHMRTVGLSDITVNRSQEWHVDLLRGPYRHLLTTEDCWGPNGGGVYKVLVYLQPGRSLRYIPGAHGAPLPLVDDHHAEPQDEQACRTVEASVGDVILMDIRLPHRGSTEQELDRQELRRSPKILVSTVLGGIDKPLTRSMEIGNFQRLMDWDQAHSQAPAPVHDTTPAFIQP